MLGLHIAKGNEIICIYKNYPFPFMSVKFSTFLLNILYQKPSRNGGHTQQQQQVTENLCFLLSLKSMFYCRILSLIYMIPNLNRNIYYNRAVEK